MPILASSSVFDPEQLVDCWRWFPTWRSYGERYGLVCKEDGSVAERGFLKLLTQMTERDFALQCIAAPSSVLRPWRPAFHIDATPISTRSGFTHAGITLGGMYKNKRHVQSEVKLMTLAVSTVKDNASGQRKMLGDGRTTGISAEFAGLNDAGAIVIVMRDMDAADSEDPLVLVSHCKPVV
eukprot:6196489-Pleurochrysis_carterae.AAC.5